MSFNGTVCEGQWINMCDATNPSQCASMNQAVAVTPKITAMLSMIGVSLIIYRFFAMKPKHRKTYDRLLLGMSIMNFWGSLAFFLGQWTFYSISSGERTSPFCNWQGWLLQINSAVFWYNGVLATNFVLRIRLGWSEDKVRRWEPLMHAVAWLYPALTSFIALGMNMYGRAGPWCWIFISFDWARWAFFFAELWVIMIYTACCMFLIVLTVKRSDDQTAHIRDGHSSSSTKKTQRPKRLGQKTRQVAIQAMLYVATFLLTWVFGTANRIQNAIVANTASPCNVFALVWLHSLFVPAQGFFNFVVYLYPRMRESDKRKAAKVRAGSTSGESKQSCWRVWFCVSETTVRAVHVVFGGDRTAEPKTDSRGSGPNGSQGNQEKRQSGRAGSVDDAKDRASQAASADVPSEAPKTGEEDDENSNQPTAVSAAKPKSLTNGDKTSTAPKGIFAPQPPNAEARQEGRDGGIRSGALALN
jgi:hypothetical protein